jgi:hypothetical protein
MYALAVHPLGVCKLTRDARLSKVEKHQHRALHKKSMMIDSPYTAGTGALFQVLAFITVSIAALRALAFLIVTPGVIKPRRFYMLPEIIVFSVYACICLEGFLLLCLWASLYVTFNTVTILCRGPSYFLPVLADEMTSGVLAMRVVVLLLSLKMARSGSQTLLSGKHRLDLSRSTNFPVPLFVARDEHGARMMSNAQHALYIAAIGLLFLTKVEGVAVPLLNVPLAWAIFFIVDDFAIVRDYSTLTKGFVLPAHRIRIWAFNVIIAAGALVAAWQTGVSVLSVSLSLTMASAFIKIHACDWADDRFAAVVAWALKPDHDLRRAVHLGPAEPRDRLSASEIAKRASPTRVCAARSSRSAAQRLLDRRLRREHEVARVARPPRGRRPTRQGGRRGGATARGGPTR